MANATLSNRERRDLLKAIPATPRKMKGAAVVRVAAVKPPKDPDDKDGLDWLNRKGRLTPAQLREGLLYRQGFLDAGEVSIVSSLADPDRVRSTAGSALPGGGVASMTEARRAMFVARFVVLRGQVDMLTVMDGVCGLEHTLRYLAGGNQVRASELEVSLKIALDMLVAYRAGPPAGAKEGD